MIKRMDRTENSKVERFEYESFEKMTSGGNVLSSSKLRGIFARDGMDDHVAI